MQSHSQSYTSIRSTLNTHTPKWYLSMNRNVASSIAYKSAAIQRLHHPRVLPYSIQLNSVRLLTRLISTTQKPRILQQTSCPSPRATNHSLSNASIASRTYRHISLADFLPHSILCLVSSLPELYRSMLPERDSLN